MSGFDRLKCSNMVSSVQAHDLGTIGALETAFLENRFSILARMRRVMRTHPLKEGCPAITKIYRKCWFHKVNSKFQITLKTSEMMYLDPRNILSNVGQNPLKKTVF